MGEFNRLVFSGPQCCGKSTVSTYFAELLGIDKIEIDDWVQDFAEMSIPQYVGLNGSTKFRNLESSVIEDALFYPSGKVISLGGGALVHEMHGIDRQNLENIYNNNGLIVTLFPFANDLDKSVGYLFKRMENADNSHRINLGNMREVLETRLPLYRDRTSLFLDPEDRDVDETNEFVLEKLLEKDYFDSSLNLNGPLALFEK